MRAKMKRPRIHLFDQGGLPPEQIQVLKVFIYAVMGGTVWGNITTGYAMTRFMKDLGASDLLYGLVIAMPPLANAFQFLISYWMEKTRKRLKLLLISGIIQRSVWLPIALVPLVIPMSQPTLRLWTVVILVMVSAGMSPAMNVSFFSLLNDVIPMRIRGRYLATRSKIATIVGMCMGFVTGLLLDRLPVFTNYAVVFSMAGVFGLFDICCYLFAKFPEMKPVPVQDNLLRMLRAVLSDKRYMRIVLSLTCWFFSVQLASPFMAMYSGMENGVGMTSLQVMLSGQIIYSFLLIFVVSKWGRAMDEYGNKPVLVIAATLTSFVPAFWIRIGPGMFWVATLSNAISGATYCAVDMSNQNLFMVQAPEKNRSMYYAVYFIFTQLFGLAFGSMTAGFLLDNVFSHIDPLGITLSGVPFTRYNALFALSFVTRLFSALALLATIDADAPRHTLELARAMVRRPGITLRAVWYGIRRWHLRKQYDGKLDSEE